jgi:hypothetical protein
MPHGAPLRRSISLHPHLASFWDLGLSRSFSHFSKLCIAILAVLFSVWLFGSLTSPNKTSNANLTRQRALDTLGFSSLLIAHADCGGMSSALHLIVFLKIDLSGVGLLPCVPRTLKHVLNAALAGSHNELPSPWDLGWGPGVELAARGPIL